MSDTDWIRPGAEVVLHRTGEAWHVSRSTVEKIAAKSFTVVGLTERIQFVTMASKRLGGSWHRFEYKVLRPESAESAKLFERERRAGVRSRAGVFSDRFVLDNVENLDAAIAALTEWRACLAASLEED